MRQENASFISFDQQHSGLIFDNKDHEKYPISYYSVINGHGIDIHEGRSYYGFVHSGVLCIRGNKDGHGTLLSEGQFFSRVGDFHFDSHYLGSAVVIEVFHGRGIYPQTKFRAMSLYGGPIEAVGRLNYIDQCTDSILVPPVKLGDPCFNHLHFPKNIRQTMHIHPSHRIGIVAKGEGECITPFGILPLTKGMIFVIKESDGTKFAQGLDGKDHELGSHCFNTYDQEMDVIAFHPDSDFGPTDIDHPMINRTIVNGVSANSIPEIQTHD